ncbi:hypothetical protein Gorai_016675, partial [Gossypium raimondii]|nr:hypothetical protein [Gossypium raimondii]
SFTWSSFAAAAEAFKDCFGWPVRSDNRINIRIDNWGLEGLHGGVLNSNMLNPNECSVKDLWLGDCRSWNIGKVHELYGKDLVSLFLVILKEMGLGPHRFFWKALWKLDTIPKATLSIGGWNENTILKEYKSCIDWLEDMMRVLDKRAMANLMTTMWNCWNNRNSFIFRGKEKEVQVIWDRASTLSQDFAFVT